MNNTAREQMAVEVAESDVWAARALKDLNKSVAAWRDCGRCQGKGYAHFLGGDRAPGVCFGCAGKGKVIKGRLEAQRVSREAAVIEINRLRFNWVAVNKATKNWVESRPYLQEYEIKRLTTLRDSIEDRARDLSLNLK